LRIRGRTVDRRRRPVRIAFVDVTGPSAVKNAVHEIERTVGSIALAVRAAGVLTEKPFASVDEELWNKTLEVHPRGQRAPQGRLPDTLPALGLDSVSGDVSIVQATLDSIPGDKILVGHSYGGFVITNAAIGRSDVRGLVSTAAYVPDTGETINSLSVGYTQGAFLAHLLFAPSFPFVIVDPQFFPRAPHALQDTLREADRTSGSLDRNLIPARWPPSPSRFGRVPTAEGDSRPWGRRSRWRALSEPAVYAD